VTFGSDRATSPVDVGPDDNLRAPTIEAIGVSTFGVGNRSRKSSSPFCFFLRGRGMTFASPRKVRGGSPPRDATTARGGARNLTRVVASHRESSRRFARSIYTAARRDWPGTAGAADTCACVKTKHGSAALPAAFYRDCPWR